MKRYAPLLPVYALYLTLFLIGLLGRGMWQPMASIAFYAALGQAFNIFLGLTGYVDFGYVAFLALGAYGMALAVSSLPGELGLGLIAIGLALGLVLAGLLSLLVGAVALRLRGAYFAIATIGVNEGFRYLLTGIGLWGGSEGIILTRHLRQAFSVELANRLSTFWADVLVFLIAALAAWLTLRYLRGKVGYALTALREDEDAAQVMGVPTVRYKILAFITSAAFAGLIGAVSWALKQTYVFPEDVFAITYTVEAIVIVLLGGAGTLLGPVVGGLIYGALKYWLAVLFPGLQLLLLAPIIIVVIVALPQGIVGMLKARARGTVLEPFVL